MDTFEGNLIKRSGQIGDPPLTIGRPDLPREMTFADLTEQNEGERVTRFCGAILRRMPVDWESAQTQELSYWKGTVTSVAAVLSEIEEVTRLVEFGTTCGSIGTVGAVVELGVGPLGIGWSAIGDADRAVGVDPLPRLIVSTGDRVVDDFARSLQERTDYLQADATKPIPLDPGVFDLVVCDNVIDHTQDPEAILVESARLAKPGGTLLFGVNVFSALGLVKWRQVTRRLHAHDFNVICHPHSFREDHLPRLLAAAGWRIIYRSPTPIRQRIAGRVYRARLIAVKG
jgi:SAM-dependent methyltransferase